jgi:hypothetical protein
VREQDDAGGAFGEGEIAFEVGGIDGQMHGPR